MFRIDAPVDAGASGVVEGGAGAVRLGLKGFSKPSKPEPATIAIQVRPGLINHNVHNFSSVDCLIKLSCGQRRRTLPKCTHQLSRMQLSCYVCKTT